MKTKMKKIITTIIIALVIISNFMPIANATISVDDYEPKVPVAKDFGAAFGMTGTILNAIVTVGVVISIVTIMGLGIKYMAGSVEEKAEYKKTMIPILVGMIMLFCITTFVGVLYNIVSQATA